MDSTSDKFLAGASLTQDENAGIARGNRSGLGQHMFQCRTLTHDFFKVQFGADFNLQVEFLLLQFVGKFRNFTVGASVIQSNGDLSCHLFQ